MWVDLRRLDGPTGDELPDWVTTLGEGPATVVLICGTLVLFWALATVCEERFVPALSVICEVCGIPDDVAGATIMAAGASSPEVFSSLIALFVTHSSLGVGTVVGSEIFNHLCICACSVLCAKGGRLVLDRAIVLRECTFYLVSLVLLLVFLTREHHLVGGQDRIIVRGYMPAALLGAYVAYVLVCVNFAAVKRCFVSSSEAVAVSGCAEPACTSVTSPAGRPKVERGASLRRVIVEPSANFVGAEPSETTAYSSVDEDAETGDPVPRPAPYDRSTSLFARLNTMTANLVAHRAHDGLFESLAGYDPTEIEESDGLLGCYLFRHSRFYHNTRAASAHEWALKWVVLDRKTGEIRIFRHRDDAESLELAAVFLLASFEVVDRKRGLLSLHMAPLATDDFAAVESHAVLAPCASVFEAFVEVAAVAVEHREAPKLDEKITKHNADAEPSLVEWPHATRVLSVAGLAHVLLFPLKAALHLTIVDVRELPSPSGAVRAAGRACLACVLWLALLSLAMCSFCETIGVMLGLSDAVVGITFSAVGTSLPNLVASMVVAKKGMGNMAVSNALGSNTFNVLVGLGFPWAIYCALYGPYDGLPAEDIVAPVLVLLVTLALFLLLLLCTGFVLVKKHAYVFLFAYVAFLVWALN